MLNEIKKIIQNFYKWKIRCKLCNPKVAHPEKLLLFGMPVAEVFSYIALVA